MEISVCMSFRNEGAEVAKTCKSVRETAPDIPIVCVNDGSNDGYDYISDLKPYNVIYYQSPYPMGSSLGRQKAIDLVPTEWFILLDAHCRMLTKDWIQKIEEANLNPNGIYCCACVGFDENDSTEGRTKGYAAYLRTDNPKKLLDPQWNTPEKRSETEIFDTQVILGANYICNKTWWYKIGGHFGFRRYSREEPFLSFKTRMAGGDVKCIPYILTGHKFRKKPPFDITREEFIYNELATIYICAPHLFEKYVELQRKNYGDQIINSVLRDIGLNIYELENERIRVKNITVVPFEANNTGFNNL